MGKESKLIYLGCLKAAENTVAEITRGNKTPVQTYENNIGYFAIKEIYK